MFATFLLFVFGQRRFSRLCLITCRIRVFRLLQGRWCSPHAGGFWADQPGAKQHKKERFVKVKEMNQFEMSDVLFVHFLSVKGGSIHCLCTTSTQSKGTYLHVTALVMNNYSMNNLVSPNLCWKFKKETSPDDDWWSLKGYTVLPPVSPWGPKLDLFTIKIKNLTDSADSCSPDYRRL